MHSPCILRFNLLLCLSILTFWSHRLHAEATISDGVLDISTWDGREQIKAFGKVYVFEGKLLEPDQFRPEMLDPSLLQHMPDETVNRLQHDPKNHIMQRTYVFQVRGFRSDRPMAWLTGWVTWASRIYIIPDGTAPLLIASSGSVGDGSEESVIPAYERLTPHVIPNISGSAYFLIQIASRSYQADNPWPAAVVDPFILGDRAQILSGRKRQHSESFQIGRAHVQTPAL